MTKLALAAAVTLTFMTVSSRTADVPIFDIDEACREFVSRRGGYDRRSHNGCIDIAQRNYDLIRLGWPVLTEQEQRGCLKDVEGHTPVSAYEWLKTCVEREVRNAELSGRTKRTFRPW